MKKIAFLLLIFLSSFSGYSQFFQGFQDPLDQTTGLPANWNKYHLLFNSANQPISSPTPSKFWVVSTVGACEGTQAASVGQEFIGQGNTEQDFLVTPPIFIPENGQLQF